MTEQKKAGASSGGFLKLALEVGPLAAFFLSYNRGGQIAQWAGFSDMQPIFVATAVFMVVMSASVICSRIMFGKVAVMPLVTLAVVLV